MVSNFFSCWRVLSATSLLVLAAVWSGVPCASALAPEDTATAAASPELPRYRFEAGQELIYENTATEDLLRTPEDEQNGKSRSDNHLKWWVWVAKQNDDGSWRLLIRNSIKLIDVPAEGDPKVNFENDFLGYCDLRPDGSFSPNLTLGKNSLFKIDPTHLFVWLPSDAKGLRDGWEYTQPLDQGHYTMHVEQADVDLLTIAGSVSKPDDINYQLQTSQQFDFDLRRGLVTRIGGESKADWTINPWHNRYTFSLQSAEQRDPQWVAKFSHEADQYFAVIEKWWDQMGQAGRSHSKDSCKAILDQLRQSIVSAREQADLDETRELYDAWLALHDREAKWALESAAAREELYAKPPIGWETTELDGTPRRRADYLGKVVLMDFWYRGCGHCIEALPKVKELAAKYQDKNVAVLGLNNDSEDADAKYVIDAFELRYPILHAGDIPKQYFVDTWPTFIVLDQNGHIAEFLEGDADDLVQSISTVVDQLLADPPQDTRLQAASVPPPGKQ
jgi:thiol-disulfide isomerase/thioredoxin